MCSVVGCGSSRRSVQRFKLPEDPERRLEWVQFILEVNGQRLKESSWTDITVCTEHFADDCFVNLTRTGSVQLKPGAVPSLCVRSEPEEPVESPQYVDPAKTTDAECQCEEDPEICNIPTTGPKNSERILPGAVSSGSTQRKVPTTDANEEKAALLQMKGKYIVNENCLLELFGRKCPSCGCKLQMEKVTCGVLIWLNQRCLKCDYRNQWKSQIDAGDKHLTGGAETTPETQQTVPEDDNPRSAVLSEVVTFSDEDSDASDDGVEGDEGGVSSDGEWKPAEDFSLAEELTKDSEEETEDEGEEEDFCSPGGLKINELCTECGSFFNILKPHTCEHKIKPYSCNICGKRCVTEISLKNHSKIHDETYEHPCKYCYVTFRTRVDKLKHEQVHQDRKDPYKCPDCLETFATGRKRNAHLAQHRAPQVFKCGICGIDFKDVHHLRRHSVVHTGLKPYKCSVCERGFNQASHLKSHMRLHTGERPYKCQHCDKCFNHNVSLKSHVQRYHTSSSGRRRETGQVDKRVKDAGDAEDNGTERDTDYESDNVEEQETVGRVRKKKVNKPKKRKRSTGRPRGRPKRNTALAGELEDQRLNTKKSKVRKLKLKTGSSDEESEDEPSGNDSTSAEEEEEEEDEKEAVRKSTGSSRRRRPKNDSDCDFEPEEETNKKRYSSQNSSKSSRKHRGRPKKSLQTQS